MSENLLYEILKALAQKRGITVNEHKLPEGLYGCLVSFTKNHMIFVDRDFMMSGILLLNASGASVFIEKSLPVHQKILTISHQLGHYMLHQSKDRVLDTLSEDSQFRELNPFDYNLLEHQANSFGERLLSFC